MANSAPIASVPATSAPVYPATLPLAKLPEEERARRGAYVRHFNARDFDAIRSMIADDVRLDLVNSTRINGNAEVARYFGNYEGTGIW
jgi:RNA polymerase sigma-70 factor (ECF subfamily)